MFLVIELCWLKYLWIQDKSLIVLAIWNFVVRMISLTSVSKQLQCSVLRVGLGWHNSGTLRPGKGVLPSMPLGFEVNYLMMGYLLSLLWESIHPFKQTNKQGNDSLPPLCWKSNNPRARAPWRNYLPYDSMAKCKCFWQNRFDLTLRRILQINPEKGGGVKISSDRKNNTTFTLKTFQN